MTRLRLLGARLPFGCGFLWRACRGRGTVSHAPEEIADYPPDGRATAHAYPAVVAVQHCHQDEHEHGGYPEGADCQFSN